MYFKLRKTQCLEIDYLFLARSQVFSENTFGGIINGKRDIHLFEDYLFVLPRKSKFVQYYIT